MPAIRDIVLFWSEFSNGSVYVKDSIQRIGLDIRYVQADTKAIRERLANGKHFQVKAVPTLVVVHSDGNAEIYQGRDIAKWIDAATEAIKEKEREFTASQPSRPPKSPTPEQLSDDEASDDEQFQLLDDEPEEDSVKEIARRAREQRAAFEAGL